MIPMDLDNLPTTTNRIQLISHTNHKNKISTMLDKTNIVELTFFEAIVPYMGFDDCLSNNKIDSGT